MIERERRFRFKESPPKNDITGTVKIEQAYVNSDNDNPYSIRIRKSWTEDFIGYSHCVKYYLKNGKVEEIEDNLNQMQYETILNLIDKRPIKKTRVLVNIKQDDKIRVAEIDYFEDGEIIIEVEFYSLEDEENFVPPFWFGDEIISTTSFSFEKFNMKNTKDLWKKI